MKCVSSSALEGAEGGFGLKLAIVNDLFLVLRGRENFFQ